MLLLLDSNEQFTSKFCNDFLLLSLTDNILNFILVINKIMSLEKCANLLNFIHISQLKFIHNTNFWQKNCNQIQVFYLFNYRISRNLA